MQKNKHILLIVAAVGFLLLSFGSLHAQKTVVKGEAELTKFDFNTQNAELSGEWYFDWKKQYETHETDELKKKQSFFKMPGLWNEKKIEGKLRKGDGFATYYAEIKIADSIEHLALRMKRIHSAYSLYINDSLYIKSGNAGTNIFSTKPDKKNLMVVFPVRNGKFEITLHVSNFHHRKGGIDDAPIIGLEHNIERSVHRALGYELFIIGALLIMAFYHLGIFFLRRKEYSSLFFGLLALSVILHQLANGEVLFSRLIPAMRWEIIQKIDFISNYLQVLFFLLFFRELLRKYIPKLIAKAVVIISIAAILLIFLTPARIYTETLIAFEIFGTISILYIIISQFRALLKKEKLMGLNLLGTFILIAAALHDILFEKRMLDTRYLVPFAVFLFMIIQSYILALRFSKLIEKNSGMNKQMREIDAVRNSFMQKTGFNINGLLDEINKHFDADRGLILSFESDKLKTIAEQPETDDNSADKFPKKILNDAIYTKQTQLIQKSRSADLLTESYRKKYNPEALLSLPIIEKKSVKYILHLEKYRSEKSFTAEEKTVLELLSGQIAGLIENNKVYAALENLNSNLEEIIEQRTAEVYQQREELQTQRDAIENQNKFLSEIYKEISEKNKILTDGIRYAKRIQSALMPDKQFVNSLFPDNFILFKPKDILSGDFYWAIKTKGTEGKTKYIFTAADCTGHGVPGALMSIIGNNLLYEATIADKRTEPGKILDYLQKHIKHQLNQSGSSDSKDGMDLAVITYTPDENRLEFAGARNPLFLVREGELTEYKADRMSIGGIEHARVSEQKSFTTKQVDLLSGDTIYLFSDGYTDQIGGEHQRKFMKKRFKQLLTYIDELDMKNRNYQLNAIFEKWRGEIIQTDDVIVTGIRF